MLGLLLLISVFCSAASAQSRSWARYTNVSTTAPTSACSLPTRGFYFDSKSASHTTQPTAPNPNPTGNACDACCAFYPVASQAWTWSQISAVPVTVGTVLFQVDRDTNQTGTTTILHTLPATVTQSNEYGLFNHQVEPTSWSQNGTFVSSTLTATKTAFFQDLEGHNRTLVYPTPSQQIAASQTWMGRLPFTSNGIPTCLSNAGSASPLPTATSDAAIASGVADLEDPFGVWFTLKPMSVAPISLSPANVSSHFGDGIIASIYTSCSTVPAEVHPATSVNVASFLLDTSTSYGSFSITTSPSPATPAPEKPSPESIAPSPQSSAPTAAIAPGIAAEPQPAEDTQPNPSTGTPAGGQNPSPAAGGGSTPVSQATGDEIPSTAQAGGGGGGSPSAPQATGGSGNPSAPQAGSGSPSAPEASGGGNTFTPPAAGGESSSSPQATENGNPSVPSAASSNPEQVSASGASSGSNTNAGGASSAESLGQQSTPAASPSPESGSGPGLASSAPAPGILSAPTSAVPPNPGLTSQSSSTTPLEPAGSTLSEEGSRSADSGSFTDQTSATSFPTALGSGSAVASRESGPLATSSSASGSVVPSTGDASRRTNGLKASVVVWSFGFVLAALI